MELGATLSVMRSELPLVACSLGVADQQTRLADWFELLGQATSRHEMRDGVRYVFAADEDTRRRLEALVTAEQSCCSFLDFEITQAGQELMMAVTAPGDGQQALRFIFMR